MSKIDEAIQTLRDIKKLMSRHAKPGVVNMNEEALTEQQFVRGFGTKVKAVRWSGRLDMVGLTVLGKNTGICITRGPDGKRRVRAIDVIDGKMHVTTRYLLLKDKDSLSNLQRGLLNWIQ